MRRPLTEVEHPLLVVIRAIRDEAKSPTCMSYEYDPTPTGEERLRNIAGVCDAALSAALATASDASELVEHAMMMTRKERR